MKRSTSGFTFVEIVIIAPIVILAIGAFISVFVTLTADVLVSRAQGQMTFELQDTANKIQRDVAISTSFLATNSFGVPSPQGVNDNTTAFTNADSVKGQALILSQYATIGNPVAGTSGYVFLANTPHACNSPSLRQNSILEVNIVYFVKNNSLWRRVIMPSTYATTSCTTPWQQPSCAVGITNAFCITNDSELASGVGANDFTLTYYSSVTTTTATPQASDSSVALATRAPIVASMKAVQVSITANQSVAGHTAQQSVSRRINLPE